MFVTPSEYDHIGEPEPVYSKFLEGTSSNASLLRVDLTFDDDSQIVHNTFLRRISSGHPFTFNPQRATAVRSPIKTSDVQKAVQAVLNGDQFRGKSYLLEGPDQFSYKDIITALESSAGVSAKLNECKQEQFFSPIGFGVFGELLYTHCYLNSQGIIHSGRTGKEDPQLIKADETIIPKKERFVDYYTPNRFAGMKAHNHNWIHKFFLN